MNSCTPATLRRARGRKVQAGSRSFSRQWGRDVRLIYCDHPSRTLRYENFRVRPACWETFRRVQYIMFSKAYLSNNNCVCVFVPVFYEAGFRVLTGVRIEIFKGSSWIFFLEMSLKDVDFIWIFII